MEIDGNQWHDALDTWYYWVRRHLWPSLRDRIDAGDCDD